MRVCIVGAGPAGKLAALVAHRAGCAVRLLENGPGTPQDRHVHLVRDGVTAVLAGLDPALGRALAASAEPGHRWVGLDGIPRPAPRLTREGLVSALDSALVAAGLAPLPGDPGALTPDAADLWIDASGGARALARLREAQGLGHLTLDDLGAPEVWRSTIWEGALPGAPFTLVMPGRLYLEGAMTMTRATGPDGPLPVLPPGYALPAGAPVTRLRMAGPPVRLARWQGAPLLLLGDARLQTPPAMGFGLMATAQQAVLLAQALREGRDPEPALADWAESVWMGAGLQASLMDQALEGASP